MYSKGLVRAFRRRTFYIFPIILLSGGLLLEETVREYELDPVLFWFVVFLIVMCWAILTFPLTKKARFKLEIEYLENLLNLMVMESSNSKPNSFARLRTRRFCDEYGISYPKQNLERNDIWLKFLDAMVYCAEFGDLEFAKERAEWIVKRSDGGD